MKITKAEFIEKLVYNKLAENFESKYILQALIDKSFIRLKHQVYGFIAANSIEQSAIDIIKRAIAETQTFRQLEINEVEVESEFAAITKNNVHVNPLNFNDKLAFETSLKTYKKSLKQEKNIINNTRNIDIATTESIQTDENPITTTRTSKLRTKKLKIEAESTEIANDIEQEPPSIIEE